MDNSDVKTAVTVNLQKRLVSFIVHPLNDPDMTKPIIRLHLTPEMTLEVIQSLQDGLRMLQE